jgi:hypothetical protein
MKRQRPSAPGVFMCGLLPDPLDGIERKFLVVGEDGKRFSDGLRNEQAVGGVAVWAGRASSCRISS